MLRLEIHAKETKALKVCASSAAQCRRNTNMQVVRNVL